MDLPQPPRDTSLKNIIDKLAEFVARNGPEFEAITKAKQKGNPKFEFLYGGEFYNYYEYKVASEQAFLKQQASISQGQTHHNQTSNAGQIMSFPPPQPPIANQQQNLWPNGLNNLNGNSSAKNITSQIEAINIQQNTLREQILQSEQNLSAQHGVLMQQQQLQIEDAITNAQSDLLQSQAEENSIRLSEFDAILQPIIESCTKDSISSGKNWILQHTSDTSKCNVVLQYLLKKALVNGSTFTQKLHLIYLINDVLHHCVRKNANDLKCCLENVVIPMFCSAELIATDEQKMKLAKLLSLWESKAKFFDACVISKLRSPESSMKEYKTNLINIHNNIVSQYAQGTKATFENYQQQHQMFIQHATQQIAVLETQKQALEQQVLANVLPNTNMIPPLMDSYPGQTTNMNSNGLSSNINKSNNDLNPIQMSFSNTITDPIQQQPPPLMAQKISLANENAPYLSPIDSNNSNQSNLSRENIFSNLSIGNPLTYPPQIFMQSYPQAMLQNINSIGQEFNGNEYLSPNAQSFQIPDLSKPPPGFTSSSVQPEEEIIPTAPYYDLPAGLMVPLIRLEDYNYKPLNPDDVRLPPPTPQNDRLSSALTAFYSLPSHDRPRDVEGWEKLGLYEYYKVKNAARKQKEEEIQNGIRQKSKSPSPIHIELIKNKKSKKRCYRSKSRSRSKSSSKSRSPRRSRSRSRTPPQPERNRTKVRHSRSPKKSPIRDRDRDRERDHRDRNLRERERSVSPPSFFTGNFAKPNDFIEETNKGHQMLMKMGWAGTGTGLGTKGQGIEAPVSSGEVRDKRDLYKGVGLNMNDPYENFRKNKCVAYIHRMRSRTEEKS